jgi:hypothetical protein
MNLLPSVKRLVFNGLLPVLGLVILAILARLGITSHPNHYQIAGSDGPYYMLQVKCLLEKGRLGYIDMPFLFGLTAIFAKLLILLQVAAQNEAIGQAVRILDAALPPLAAIPVFFIAKEITLDKKLNWGQYLLIAFSILNFVPLVVFSYQLQKNGLAVVWVFSFLYYLVRIVKDEKRTDFYRAGLIMFLCAITHLGSFGLLTFIGLAVITTWFIRTSQLTRGRKLRLVVPLLLVACIALMIIAIFDNTRFVRLLGAPLQLFEAPALLYALAGQNFFLNGSFLFIISMTNVLVALAIIATVHHRKTIEPWAVVLCFALAGCTFLLSSPMLGLEWAKRLYYLSYLPLTVLYLVLLPRIQSFFFRFASLGCFALLLSYSVANAVMLRPILSISDASLVEFEQIKQDIFFTKNDVLVGRQDLMLLGSWFYGTKGIADYLLTKSAYHQYQNVYLIKQIAGKNAGIREKAGVIPPNTKQVYKGYHFEVYALLDDSGLPNTPDKIFKGVIGEIVAVAGQKILVKDSKTGIIKTVFIRRNTEFFLDQPGRQLETGMKIKINGAWKVFSTALVAERVISSFE